MAKVAVYNEQGVEAGDITLNDDVFGVRRNASVVHQVYVALEANAREAWAHTKDKSDVRGGGKKPWQQKGTGRARHGSIRSPIWSGGGVTFGPRNDRSYTQKINKKVSGLAVRMCLSDKVAESKLLVLDALILSGKTKQVATLRGKLPGAGKSTLILMDEKNDNLLLSTRNMPTVHVQRVQDVNVVDLLHHQYIIATKAGVAALEARLA